MLTIQSTLTASASHRNNSQAQPLPKGFSSSATLTTSDPASGHTIKASKRGASDYQSNSLQPSAFTLESDIGSGGHGAARPAMHGTTDLKYSLATSTALRNKKALLSYR